MYPWKHILTSEAYHGPHYLHIAKCIIEEIRHGRLQPNQKLPGTRYLAELVQVNRKTIVRAYEEMMSEGWIVSLPSSGTYVAEKLPLISGQDIDELESTTTQLTEVFENLSYIPNYRHVSYEIRIDGGSPDVRLAPMDFLYKECKSISNSRNGYKLMEYGDPAGSRNLRHTLSQYLAETRGINSTSDQILITGGSQMGIYLTIHALLSESDIVIVGESSYDAADWAIRQCRASMVRIPVDEDGLNIDALEAQIKIRAPRLVYITPHHHFPTTVTLSHARRLQLLQLSIKHNFYILEDDYDYDFHYKGSPILPLASINTGGRTIYVGSFSKIYAPAIRIGYVIASENLLQEIIKHRRLVDRQSDMIMQEAIGASIREGILNRHIRKSILKYRERRDFLADQLKKRFDGEIEFSVPEGGMAIWSVFRKGLQELAPHLQNAGLQLDIDKDLTRKFNGVRLGFASKNPEELTKAMDLLERAFKLHAS